MPPRSPSLSSDSRVEAPRRGTIEDDETILSSHLIIPNEDFVVSTEDDVPVDLPDAAQLPTTEGLGEKVR